jgi:anaerobic magnesium-protoporphyrin IX monomethyl ester cyclase
MLDAEAEDLTPEQIGATVRELAPSVAAVCVSGTNPSASTMSMAGVASIFSAMEEEAPNVKRLIMGLHPSALPKRTLLEENVDFVCKGEGFLTLSRLIDVLKEGRQEFNIPGLYYMQNGNVCAGPAPVVVENIDVLPRPAWDLLPMQRYRAHNWHCFENIEHRMPYGVIYSSLGCPFKCSFCCINALFGKSGIRYRSPKNVIEEIDWLVETYGIRNIKIIDEMFAMNNEHVSNLCDLIIEHGHNLNIWAYARVNTVNQNMLAKMKKAGINWVAYGFESGNQRILGNVSKGISLDKMLNIVDMTYKEGLYICANFIFGLPDDDFDSMQDTLNLAMQINAEWANFYSTMAFPGSKLYEEAIKKGIPLPETWEGYSQYSYECFPMATKYLTNKHILRFRDDAFNAYYKNPRYVNMIISKFGSAVAEHIKDMTSHKINRKILSCLD